MQRLGEIGPADWWKIKDSRLQRGNQEASSLVVSASGILCLSLATKKAPSAKGQGSSESWPRLWTEAEEEDVICHGDLIQIRSNKHQNLFASAFREPVCIGQEGRVCTRTWSRSSVSKMHPDPIIHSFLCMCVAYMFLHLHKCTCVYMEAWYKYWVFLNHCWPGSLRLASERRGHRY